MIHSRTLTPTICSGVRSRLHIEKRHVSKSKAWGKTAHRNSDDQTNSKASSDRQCCLAIVRRSEEARVLQSAVHYEQQLV